ncbi:MAG TPA: diguanylate cyclase [Albitalea sp.]|uniref:diguanylate cyclase n=1 Tax=Piscinibacter sp. TaxID=1903157 RepID=UPI002ED21C6F
MPIALLPFLRFLALVLVVLWPLHDAAAQAPLTLSDRAQRIEAWPVVTVLADPGRRMTLADARAAAGRFAPPRQAWATLGLRQEAMWLRVPLQVAADSDGHWVLDIDYAVLNRVDVHVVVNGEALQHAVLGNLQPFSQRPLASRSHAVALELPRGAPVELFLRVDTLGALALPITLNKPSAFLAHSMNEQMLQGLLTGLGLCLLLYSLMQWITLRERLYLKYLLLTSGSLLFSIYQFGIGAQYVWTDNTWIELHAGGLAALLASGATFLFVEHALRGPPQPRWFPRVMRLGALLLFATGLAYALDLVHVHQVSAVVGTLGLAPAVLGMPGAVSRARRGDPVGWYFLAAWVGYFIATSVMVGLIKGHVGVNFWTLHSFQFGATLDMLLFMRVIGLRMKAVHAAAQHATRERDTLMSLAHTDALTGLPNRRGLDATLARELPHTTPQKLLALYMIDLDGFKEVNDRFGHDAGDELLVAAARRLQSSLRASDVVARLGGDEFVVTVNGLHDDRQAQEIGSHLLEAFNLPFELSQQRSCHIGLTIGYALMPLDGDDPARLLKRADAAMYAGKQSGKRCVRRAEAVFG